LSIKNIIFLRFESTGQFHNFLIFLTLLFVFLILSFLSPNQQWIYGIYPILALFVDGLYVLEFKNGF